jgi:hypothetical protein
MVVTPASEDLPSLAVTLTEYAPSTLGAVHTTESPLVADSDPDADSHVNVRGSFSASVADTFNVDAPPTPTALGEADTPVICGG